MVLASGSPNKARCLIPPLTCSSSPGSLKEADLVPSLKPLSHLTPPLPHHLGVRRNFPWSSGGTTRLQHCACVPRLWPVSLDTWDDPRASLQESPQQGDSVEAKGQVSRLLPWINKRSSFLKRFICCPFMQLWKNGFDASPTTTTKKKKLLKIFYFHST